MNLRFSYLAGLVAVAAAGAAHASQGDLNFDFAACVPQERSVTARNGYTMYTIVGPSGASCVLEYTLVYEMVVTQARCEVPRSEGVIIVPTLDAGQPAGALVSFCEVISSGRGL
jgi:hypothetical protein